MGTKWLLPFSFTGWEWEAVKGLTCAAARATPGTEGESLPPPLQGLITCPQAHSVDRSALLRLPAGLSTGIFVEL